jgi:galactonate dehydratase|nr:mandelate racemase/muconate lactonizing enzyme family protein [uncultured Oscillibacter sp.]
MKITSIDIFLLKHVGEDFSPFPFRPVVCRINTDEGISGFGEAGISVGPGEHGVAHLLYDIGQQIIGLNPMDNEVIWEQFRNQFCGHLSGGGVIVYSAMSAIDTALLDIKGKKLGVPIYVLLGGKFRSKLKCYLSQCHLGYLDDFRIKYTEEDLANICRRIQKDGYSAVKLNLLAFDANGKPLDRSLTTGPLTRPIIELLEARLAAIRKACGNQLEIILENLCYSDVTSAIQIDRIADRYHVLMIEEATSNFNPDLYGQIFSKVRTPLSAGERVHTRWEFHQLLKQGAVSIIQPDISNCGGLSETRKICDLAHLYDVRVQCHVAGTPIAEAAAMQLEASIPNFYIHESYHMAAHPDCVAYGTHQYVPQNGYLTVPDLPGLGQELSLQAMAEALERITIA